MLKAKLVVIGGPAQAKEYSLRLPTLIGRGHEASIVIAHPLVSRRHCELLEQDGQLVVRDLGSLNGTYVGRERVEQAILPPDALLTVGSVTFRAVYQQPAEVLSAPGQPANLNESADLHDDSLMTDSDDVPPTVRRRGHITGQDTEHSDWNTP